MIARLQKKIAANKKVVADITEMAILAFDQRDEAQSKITALQDRNEKDAQQYAAELKELQRTLDHDEKLKDFLFHKSNDRAFAADFAEEERERDRKEAEAKDLEHTKMFKDAFDRIKRVVASDSSLDKIVADFIKVEDQNFALFNYVTEMNNQVEGLQESIAKLRCDIKEAKGRGDERERQQRDQLNGMERRVAMSTREADTTEAKLELMEGVIQKLKVDDHLKLKALLMKLLVCPFSDRMRGVVHKLPSRIYSSSLPLGRSLQGVGAREAFRERKQHHHVP